MLEDVGSYKVHFMAVHLHWLSSWRKRIAAQPKERLLNLYIVRRKKYELAHDNHGIKVGEK